MRRLVEVTRSGTEPNGNTWLTTTYESKPAALDRVPAWAELFGYGILIGLPAVALPLLIHDPILGPLAGLAGAAAAAAVTPRFYHSRAERQSDIELDEMELDHTFQQRQIDTLNREAAKARRR